MKIPIRVLLGVSIILSGATSAAEGQIWTSIGPDGGTVRAVAVDPTNPTILYAGTAGAGIFKSLDGGDHWSAINIGLDYWSDAYLSVSVTTVNVFAIDPITSTTVYAGTNAGLFKSVDGGGHWNLVAGGSHILALAIDPSNPSTIYGGTADNGLFKTTDAGFTWIPWTQVNGPVNAIVLDPLTPTTVYAGTTGGGVFKSIDGGGSWTRIFNYYRNVLVLAIRHQSPTTTLYAAATTEFCDEFDYCYTVFAFFTSTNGGDSWSSAAGNGLTGNEIVALTIDRQTATLYAGTSAGIFKSSDEGGSWTVVNSGLTVAAAHALAVDPVTPTILYAGTPHNGVFKTTDRGGSWIAVNTGLAATYILTVAIDPLTPTTLYTSTANGGTANGGALKSTDSGASWNAIDTGLNAPFVYSFAIDPQSPTILFAGTGGGVFKSVDSGGSWNSVSSGLAVHALVLDPVTPTTIYGATSSGVVKSTDGGASWSVLNSGLTSTNIITLAIDPVTPTTLYAGTWHDGLFKTIDAGNTWTSIAYGLRQPNVYTIAVDPQTPTTLYIGTCCYAGTNGDGVLKSTDGGNSWASVNTGLINKDIVALAVDPQMPTTLYAIGFRHAGNLSEGVFKSTNAGSSWSEFNTGMSVLNVWTLAIDPLTSTTVYAGTRAGGVFVSTGENGTINVPPTAIFAYVCTGFTCAFDASGSSDDDGTIASYTWDFGDGRWGWGRTVSHTYADGNPHIVTLTVTDNIGARSAYSRAVSAVLPTMHIGDLDARNTSHQSTWTASVTVAVHDSSHSLIANAAVSGSWNDGSSASCTTNVSGECGITKSGIAKKTHSASFSVTSVTRSSLEYKPLHNHDPDGDSNGTSINVNKP